MKWEEASEELLLLAKRLEYKAHLFRKVPFNESQDKATKLLRQATRCRRLAQNRVTLPGLAGSREEAALQLYEIFSERAKRMLSSSGPV